MEEGKSKEPKSRVGRGRDIADVAFFSALFGLAGLYVLLIVGMIVADVCFAATNVTRDQIVSLLTDEYISQSIRLTLFTCTVSALLSVLVAVPAGYLLSRYQFPGKTLLDATLDIPIVLPPLVVGLSLLILFIKMPMWDGPNFETMFGETFTYKVPGVILAQFTVACAFAVRTMRNTFDQISPRTEHIALTLGCSRARAFRSVVIPEAWRGISTAGTLAWTRSMGEFGPILVFAGATRGKTEVLSSTVFLEISIGNLEGAVIVSLLMVSIAILILIAIRIWDQGTAARYKVK